MKTFKIVDCYIQGGLFLIVLFLVALSGGRLGESFFLVLYFVTGGWQLFSVLIHWGYEKPYKVRLRKVYEVMLAATFGIGIICLFAGVFLEYMFGLLVWSPVLAILYFACCVTETNRLDEVKKAQAAAKV
jgi:hypothetical protein